MNCREKLKLLTGIWMIYETDNLKRDGKVVELSNDFFPVFVIVHIIKEMCTILKKCSFSKPFIAFKTIFVNNRFFEQINLS